MSNVAAPEASVLVLSCDRYADLWQPFFTLFHRYWPDCPYPVYLGTNELAYDETEVTSLQAGEDRGWAVGAHAVLAQIPTRYVIVLLEDYLLTAPADTARIAELVGLASDDGLGCLRLAPVPGAAVELPGLPGVGELPRGAPYRVSLQAAVWDVRTLGALILDGESPWLLETAGSQRSNLRDEAFLSVTQDAAWPLPYLATAIVRGRWIREGVELCRREGIEPDLGVRPVETSWQRLRRVRTPAAAGPAIGAASKLMRTVRR